MAASHGEVDFFLCLVTVPLQVRYQIRVGFGRFLCTGSRGTERLLSSKKLVQRASLWKGTEARWRLHAVKAVCAIEVDRLEVGAAKRRFVVRFV